MSMSWVLLMERHYVQNKPYCACNLYLDAFLMHSAFLMHGCILLKMPIMLEMIIVFQMDHILLLTSCSYFNTAI